jgi:hypothetical protein
MSFLSDAFEGHFDELGTDISHAGSSLMHHPSEMYETLGGAAALATGGLALGALPELGAAGAAAEGGADVGGLFSGMFGGAGGVPWLGTGAEAAASATDTAGTLGFGTTAIGSGGGDIASIGEGAAVNAGGAAIDPLASSGGSMALSDAAAGVGGATPSQPGFFSGITDSLMHPTLGGIGKGLGVAAAGAGLGMNLLHGNQTDPNQQKLQDLAGQLGAQGQVLESYLKTGKLPPALQAQLDQWEASKKAQIIAGYAARDKNNPAAADPRFNSALAQDLSNLKLQGLAQMAEVQVQMLNTGLKETGMSMELYQMLTKLDEQQNKDLMDSIGRFAAALGGGFGGAPARAA